MKMDMIPSNIFILWRVQSEWEVENFVAECCDTPLNKNAFMNSDCAPICVQY